MPILNGIMLNYKSAFAFVSECIADGVPLTAGLVREIHKRLVEGVRGGAACPGAYRQMQNYVGHATTGEIIYTPPPVHDVPIMMAILVEWFNREQEIHSVSVSGIAQFQLVHIHPFWGSSGLSVLDTRISGHG